MSDGDSQLIEPVSTASATTGLGTFQFGLAACFVLATATALILAAFLGVGRLIGMSTMEVVSLGFGRLL